MSFASSPFGGEKAMAFEDLAIAPGPRGRLIFLIKRLPLTHHSAQQNAWSVAVFTVFLEQIF